MVPKRVLLDENLPHKLRILVVGHTVVTTAYRGWAQKRNGELVALAEAEGFDVLVTSDQNLYYQQNMKTRRLALVVLGRPPKGSDQGITILANASRIVAAINAAQPFSYTFLSLLLAEDL